VPRVGIVDGDVKGKVVVIDPELAKLVRGDEEVEGEGLVRHVEAERFRERVALRRPSEQADALLRDRCGPATRGAAILRQTVKPGDVPLRSSSRERLDELVIDVDVIFLEIAIPKLLRDDLPCELGWVPFRPGRVDVRVVVASQRAQPSADRVGDPGAVDVLDACGELEPFDRKFACWEDLARGAELPPSEVRLISRRSGLMIGREEGFETGGRGD
jgi:hypothetical protein